MTQHYEIVWARRAEDDLREIVDYIAADSTANALTTFEKSQHRPCVSPGQRPSHIHLYAGLVSVSAVGQMQVELFGLPE